jgi:hypothetical protein
MTDWDDQSSHLVNHARFPATTRFLALLKLHRDVRDPAYSKSRAPYTPVVVRDQVARPRARQLQPCVHGKEGDFRGGMRVNIILS